MRLPSRTALLFALLAGGFASSAPAQEAAAETGSPAPAPRLLNADTVRVAMREHYPAALRQLGIGGTAVVQLLVDEQGAVSRTMVQRSSAFLPLDSAALRVAAAMRFAPARDDRGAREAWISMPLTFRPEVPGIEGPRPEVAEPPRILNAAHVQREIRSHCNRARASGAAKVAAYVGGSGRPVALEMLETSGDPAVDQAAVHAMLLAEFAPARDGDGNPVPCWMILPVGCDLR